jgi:hypothetical protein
MLKLVYININVNINVSGKKENINAYIGDGK